MQKLREAIAELEAEDDALVDPRELSSLVDRLQAKLCRVLTAGKKRGEHLLSGRTPTGWVAATCGLSPSSASDRLCVGEQLEAMPKVAAALSSGEVSYQKASVICHFRDRLREDLRELVDEEFWVERGREDSVRDLRSSSTCATGSTPTASIARSKRTGSSASFPSASRVGMYHLSGVLDREGGAALKSALDALAKPLGSDDARTPKQRRADAMSELAYQAMSKGVLPRRHGVRPHIAVTTTLEGLKGEVGAPASELQSGLPISSKTVQRLACDGSLHRVLKADSMVIDVGRARRTAQPAQWRALRARHKTCAAPGCDRPINWTFTHHVDFWEQGGHTDLQKMLPLCFYHHRLVHEGGWQVVLAGERVGFIPPDRPPMTRRRWGEWRRAA